MKERCTTFISRQASYDSSVLVKKSDIVELPGILDIPSRYLTLAPG
jgi:hypothetical protein